MFTSLKSYFKVPTYIQTEFFLKKFSKVKKVNNYATLEVVFST